MWITMPFEMLKIIVFKILNNVIFYKNIKKLK